MVDRVFIPSTIERSNIIYDLWGVGPRFKRPGIDALEPESSFPNLRQKSCLVWFLMVSHRFSCEFMELHLFFGVESVNTFPISALLPGVVSGKMALWQFSWIVLLISGASGLRMRQVALCPRTLCSGVLSEVFFAKHLVRTWNPSISICKILQVPSKNWESRKGTADMHVQQLMCHNWFSHFISKLQDSNLRFDTGWDESFWISGEWRQSSQGRFSIGSSSRLGSLSGRAVRCTDRNPGGVAPGSSLTRSLR